MLVTGERQLPLAKSPWQSLPQSGLSVANKVFSFPNPVNEKAARVVAAITLVFCITILVSGWYILIVPLALGFWARVLTGPSLSPTGWLASKVIAPRLGPAIDTPGPPKRFAQAIGTLMTTTAAVLSLLLDQPAAATVLLGVMVVFAALESIAGFCAGCWLFARLMRLGIIPDDTCEACNDIWARQT